MRQKRITEKILGITGDYQYKALKKGNFIQSNWHSNKLAVLSELLKKYKPENILDLGTGSGNFELTFYNKTKQIVGIDYNKDALNFLSKKLKFCKVKNVKLYHKDLTKLKAKSINQKFDMIIMVDVIEHIQFKNGEKLVESFSKWLTKKGVIVIITPNYGGFWPIIENLIDKFTTIPNLGDMQHVAKFDCKMLEKLFTQREYKVDKLTTFNTFSYLLPSKTLSSYLSKKETEINFKYGNLLLGIFTK